MPSSVSSVDSARGSGVSTSEYLISLMGYAIGIGNIWRFPYLVGKFGGGAFLIAYFFCLVFVAMPLYLFELAIGQDTRKSTMFAYQAMHPRWLGLGWCTAAMLVFVLTYYNVLLAYAIVYMVYSFVDPLPWSKEANPPNTILGSYSPSENFWFRTVLNTFEPDEEVNLSDIGAPQAHLVGALFLVYLMVFGAMYKGFSASAKVSYVTVGMPILLLLILLIRATTLEGASAGVEFYIAKFDGDYLSSFEMWATACAQILFSLSPGMGTAITLSSYTNPKEDVYIVNLLVSICNSSFSFIGGFAVFSIIGFMARESCSTDAISDCRTVEDLAQKSSIGLAFITLAEGVSQFGAASNFFAVLFFIMLLTLGLDSTFAWMETINTYVHDVLHSRGQHVEQWQIALGTCIGFFLLGLPYCTRGGSQLLDTIDNFAASLVLIFSCLVETVMYRIDWGWDRVAAGIKRATMGSKRTPKGRIMPAYWQFALGVTAPVVLCFLFVQKMDKTFEARYGGYSDGYQVIGWFSFFFPVALAPIGFFMNFRKERQVTNFEEPLLDGAEDKAAKQPKLGEASAIPPVVSTEMDVREREVSHLPYVPPSFSIPQDKPHIQHFNPVQDSHPSIPPPEFEEHVPPPPGANSTGQAPPPVADFPEEGLNDMVYMSGSFTTQGPPHPSTVSYEKFVGMSGKVGEA